MKKEQSDVETTENQPKPSSEHPSEMMVDVFFSEGGFSLLIIFPLTVFFYLSMALSSI